MFVPRYNVWFAYFMSVDRIQRTVFLGKYLLFNRCVQKSSTGNHYRPSNVRDLKSVCGANCLQNAERDRVAVTWIWKTTRIESRSEYRLSWQVIVVFLSVSSQNTDTTLKLPEHLLRKYYLLNIHYTYRPNLNLVRGLPPAFQIASLKT